MANLYKNGNLQIPDGTNIRSLPAPNLQQGSFQRTFKDLFSNLPCATDIVQGQTGNCGFMAAMMMLASRPDGADVIQGMMKDAYFGRVVIRVYDTQNTALYIQIPKQIPLESGEPISSTGAIWVRMLEAGYVAFKQLSFHQITGVNPETVLQTFLGPEIGESKQLKVVSSTQLFEVLVDIFYLNIEAAKLPPPNVPVGKPENYQALKNDVFGGSEDDLKDWIRWNTSLRNRRLHFDAYKQNNHIHAIRRHDFDAWWQGLGAEKNALRDPVKNAVLTWLNNANVLPGKRFTGQYSAAQIDLFDKIRAALDKKQVVTAATKNSFWRKFKDGVEVKEGSGKSGESARGGIFAKHWYGVVSVNVDAKNNTRFITLRNPHGETGRAYQNNKPVRVEGPAGVESQLEFSDFTKLADEVMINGKPVNPVV